MLLWAGGCVCVCVCRFVQPTRVGHDQVSSLVVEGPVGGAGRVAAPGQALVPQVHGVAVVQQRLGHLKISTDASVRSVCMFFCLFFILLQHFFC